MKSAKRFVIRVGRMTLLCLLGILGLALIGGGIFTCVLGAMASIGCFASGRIDPAGVFGLISLAGGFGVILGRALTGWVFGIE